LCFPIRNQGNFCFSQQNSSPGKQTNFNEIFFWQTDVPATNSVSIFTSCTLNMRTELVAGTSANLHVLTRLSARENFMCRGSFKIYKQIPFVQQQQKYRTHKFWLLYQIRIQAKPL